MTEIIIFSEIQAKEIEKLSKRKKDLELLVHVCEITYNSIIQIEDIDRFCFSAYLNKLLTKWKRELERVNFKLGIK